MLRQEPEEERPPSVTAEHLRADPAHDARGARIDGGFDFQPRTRIVFGAGTLPRLGALAREQEATRVLLVTDPGIERAGHVGRAVDSLGKAGLEVVVFDGVEENPTAKHVEAGVEVAKRSKVDALVGLGGGSAMDCAKGVNFITSCGGTMRDYQGVGQATGPMLPMIAVPTTAGTGSETQSFALITDSDSHQKMACGDPRAACRVALLDPELTLSQPEAVTAATGIDAIAHAVETMVTTRRTPLSTVFAREAWRLLAGSFRRVLEAPDDVDARGRMLLGASYAGLAIENSMLGATHACANPLTAHYGTVHGVAIGVMLPHVIRFNAAVVDDEYAALAAIGEQETGDFAGAGGERLARQVETIHWCTGLPRTLRLAGVDESILPALAQSATEQWTAQFNPRPLTANDFEELYRCAY